MAGMDLGYLEFLHRVSLTIRPKKSGDGKSAVIRSAEANLNNAYALRKILLGAGRGPKAEAVRTLARQYLAR